MELKNITELETQYPTDKQIDKKELRKNIPTKWTKLGLTAFIFNLMMSGKAFAKIDSFKDAVKWGEIAGGGPVEVEILSTGVQGIVPQSIKYISMFFHTVPIIVGIITIIQAIKYKINKKKAIHEEQILESKERMIEFAKITAILIIIDVFFVMIGRDILIELF